ncbi:MAG: T9SS type A sorting domain-containing protein, partial [Candidatus Kapaibacterium sp.]
NDGYLDIWSSQYSYDSFDAAATKKYSRVYLNEGKDGNFNLKDMTWEFGSKIHGAWTALRLDYDLDGDMDLLVCSNQENVKLFENRLSNMGNFLNLRIDKESVAKGYSARIANNDKTLFRSNQGIVSTGRISQSTNMLHFGLGDQDNIVVLQIEHNGNEGLLLDGLKANTNYWMNRQGNFVLPTRPKLITPLNELTVKMSDKLVWKPMWNVEEIELIVAEKGGDEIYRDTIDYTTTYRIRDIDSIDISKVYTWQIIGKRRGDETLISDQGSFKFDFKSSVSDEIVGLTITIYPNPIKDMLNLKMKSKENKLYTIELIDLTGRNVSNFGKRIIGGETDLQFDVSQINSGNYSLVISDDKGKSNSIKVMIAK